MAGGMQLMPYRPGHLRPVHIPVPHREPPSYLFVIAVGLMIGSFAIGIIILLLFMHK